MKEGFSFARFWALVRKEFILMKRDPGVIIIMAILPLILVCLTGYAVNINPKKVPTVILSYDDTDITRDLIQTMKNTEYFNFIGGIQNEEDARLMLRSGKALLILTIPENFTKEFVLGHKPSLLFEDGATDVFATGKALSALPGLITYYLSHLNTGVLISNTIDKDAHVNLIIHKVFDPEHNTYYSLIPGMIGLVLMLTMLMITVVIAFRDVQGGTLECLLVSPAEPIEILFAQIVSYIIIGYVQLSIGLALSYYLFHVPFEGDVYLLFMAVLPYIIAELSVGLTVATFCTTQFQAVQVINLLIAFSIILSGFVFPTFGMPEWARFLSNLIPLTYFLQILRSIILKGSHLTEIWQYLWPLLIYSALMITLAISRFRRYFS